MSWECKSFNEVIEDVTGGNLKTLQSDYLPAGEFPIIDQGQGLIGGYTDDEERLCKAPLPVVIFGDHTKIFKFVDFPFCLGADGTKVLRPKNGSDPKYLFYALQTAHIPDAGYSRHFKYLKNFDIPLPPIAEQKRIAAILDQADALRRLRQHAIDRLNQLGQSIFYEMFGDLGSNSTSNSLSVQLCDIAELQIGYPFKSGDYSESHCGVKLCRGANVLPGHIDWSDLARYPVARAAEFLEYELLAGDVVIAMDRPWISTGFKIAKVSDSDAGSLLVQRVARLRAREAFDSDFIYFLASSQVFQSHFCPTETTVPHISPTEIRRFQFNLPDASLREHFSQRIGVLRRSQTASIKAAALSEQIFASIQHRAFRGEL